MGIKNVTSALLQMSQRGVIRDSDFSDYTRERDKSFKFPLISDWQVCADTSSMYESL